MGLKYIENGLKRTRIVKWILKLTFVNALKYNENCLKRNYTEKNITGPRYQSCNHFPIMKQFLRMFTVPRREPINIRDGVSHSDILC